MNKNIVLLAETGSDISPEIAEKYGIYIVPMHVQMGDVTKDDGTFPPEEVCEYYELFYGCELTEEMYQELVQ